MEQVENDIFESIHFERKLSAHQPPYIKHMPADDSERRGVSYAPMIGSAAQSLHGCPTDRVTHIQALKKKSAC